MIGTSICLLYLNEPSGKSKIKILKRALLVYDLISMLKPSARGELEITDVNNLFFQEGRLNCNKLNGWWVNIGNAEHLSEAECLMQTR